MAIVTPALAAKFVDPQTGLLTPTAKALLDALQRQATDGATLDGQSGAFYLARENHTGTQSIATVAGLETALADLLTAIADAETDANAYTDAAIAALPEVELIYTRITADGDVRITADGDLRITD